MNSENISTNMARPATAPLGKQALGTPSAKFNSSGGVSKTPTMKRSELTAITPGSASREAARVAKEQSTLERIQKVAELKEKWALEKQRKKQLNKKKRQTELQRIQEESAQAAQQRQKNLEIKRAIEEKKKEEEKELLSASLQARSELAEELKKQKLAKRRISIFLNKTMQARAKQNEKAIIAAKKQEEQDLLEAKRIDHLQLRVAKAQEAENRRESLNFRLLSASKQRKIEEELQGMAAEAEKEMIELRRQNWVDDNAFLKEQKNNRRSSLAGRLNHWRSQKVVEHELKQQQKEEQLDMLKARADDWVDLQNYKKKCEDQIRESISGRLDHWREIKNIEEQEKMKEQEAHALEVLFKQEAVEDMKKFQETNKERRRASLAYRLQKAKQDHDVDLSMKAVLDMVEQEDREIRRLEREDVVAYQQKLADERRASLDYRNLYEMNDRNRLQELHQQELAQREEDFAIKTEDWQAVRAAKEAEREEKRKSLAWRMADASRKHALDLAEHEEKLNAVHEMLEWRRLVHEENEEHKKEQQARRRQSMALRQDSWRAQAIAEKQLRARKEMEQEEEACWKAEDAEALREAREMLKETKRADVAKGSFVF